jgi:hypothetical protein
MTPVIGILLTLGATGWPVKSEGTKSDLGTVVFRRSAIVTLGLVELVK